jgi:hypothetical protein
MSAASHIPVALYGSTEAEVLKKYAQFQAAQGGKCPFLAMYYNPDIKKVVLICYPVRNLGGGVM